MTPKQLAKSGTEHAHQKALFAYCNFAMMHGFETADKWTKLEGSPLESAMYVQMMGRAKRNLEPKIPVLKWLHAIPNGGARGDSKKSRIIRGGQLKAEGVKPGVPDIFLPVPIMNFKSNGDRELFAGLYIEMKKPSVKPKTERGKGGLSEEQLEFKDFALSSGYAWAVCYSWEEAVNEIKNYLKKVV